MRCKNHTTVHGLLSHILSLVTDTKTKNTSSIFLDTELDGLHCLNE